MNLIEKLNPELEKLIAKNKPADKNTRVDVSEAWKILQLAVAQIIKLVEDVAVDLSGKTKKEIAMEILSRFYDGVFTIVDIPFIPSGIEAIIHKRVKAFLMILVGSTIDAMVQTFRQNGIFKDSQPIITKDK